VIKKGQKQEYRGRASALEAELGEEPLVLAAVVSVKLQGKYGKKKKECMLEPTNVTPKGRTSIFFELAIEK
jgi:hypothetical protein